MNLSNLKIAMVYGQGLEGCGVTRVTAEFELWASKNNVKTDTFSLDEKKYVRGKSHSIKNLISFKIKDIPNIVEQLNKYDIVMFMSYPNNKYEHPLISEFYHTVYKGIQKPIKVMFVHEISKMNIDKITYLVPMLVNADAVFHFDTDTWFSKTIDELGFQKIGDRLHKFTLWANFDDMDTFRNKYKGNKKNGISTITRWSSLKNVGRSVELMKRVITKDKTWECSIHGIERSIGAKYDIIDRKDVIYHDKTRSTNPDTGIVDVYGPVARNVGMDMVASRLFATSFFSLPKQPENYGNRMEYTQIEIIGAGTIPVFDKNWGSNNKIKDGQKYIDVPYSAIYTDGTDLDEVSDLLLNIAKDDALKNKYLDTSYAIVQSEFNADWVIPATIEKILGLGKKEQRTDSEIYTEYVGSDFAAELQKVENASQIPVLGIQEVQKKELYYLDGSKQKLVQKFKKKGSVLAKNG